MKLKKKTVVCVALIVLMLSLLIIPAVASPASPSLSSTKLSLYTGQSTSLKAKGFSGKVTWKSSKKSVAAVNSKGKVSAKKKGTAVITASRGKVKKICKVTVLPVTLSKSKRTVQEGASFQLWLNCGASKGIQWKSADKSVVKIQKKSRNQVTLRALKTGKTTITATYQKNTYKCIVTVNAKPAPEPENPGPSEPADPSTGEDSSEPAPSVTPTPDPSTGTDPTPAPSVTPTPTEPSQQDPSSDQGTDSGVELPEDTF